MTNENNTSIYRSGEYTNKNPDYHSEDSSWKWLNFHRVLEKNKDQFNISEFKNIAEIGCGVGQILQNAKVSKIFNENVNFEGWDINPDAIETAKKLSPNISFHADDMFNNSDIYDLIICADVFEHVEDYYGFLDKISKKSKYILFNIPLDLNLLILLRQNTIYKDTYNKVGHIHHFTKGTALLAIKHAGLNIVDAIYAKHRLKRKSLTTKGKFLFIPQLLLDMLNEDIASSILGGASLVVLAKGK